MHPVPCAGVVPRYGHRKEDYRALHRMWVMDALGALIVPYRYDARYTVYTNSLIIRGSTEFTAARLPPNRWYQK